MSSSTSVAGSLLPWSKPGYPCVSLSTLFTSVSPRAHPTPRTRNAQSAGHRRFTFVITWEIYGGSSRSKRWSGPRDGLRLALDLLRRSSRSKTLGDSNVTSTEEAAYITAYHQALSHVALVYLLSFPTFPHSHSNKSTSFPNSYTPNFPKQWLRRTRYKRFTTSPMSPYCRRTLERRSVQGSWSSF